MAQILDFFNSVMTPATGPRKYDGRIGAALREGYAQKAQRDQFAQKHALDQQQLGLQRDQMGQQQDQFAQRHALEQQQFGHQQNEFAQKLADTEKKDRDKAIADYYDALHQGDPTKVQMATEALKQRGFDVQVPPPAGGQPQGSAAPAPAGQAAAPHGAPAAPQESRRDQNLRQSLDAMEGKVLGGLSGKPPQGRPRLSGEELMLSPGDSLLKQQGDPVPYGDRPQGPEAAPGAQPPGNTGAVPPGAQGAQPQSSAIRIMRGGQVVSELDPNKIQAGRIKVVDDTFAPLMTTGNEVQTTAARKAKEYAMGLLGQAPLPVVIEKATKLYEAEVDQLMGVHRAAASRTGSTAGPGFAGTGMSKEEYGVMDDDTKLVLQHVAKVKGDYGYKSLSDIESEARKVISAIDEKTGVGDLTAVTAAISALQGRVSDADMRQALAAGGLESSLKNFLGFAVDKGKKDAAYMKQFRSLAANLAVGASATRNKAAQQIEADIRDIGGMRGWNPDQTTKYSSAAHNLMLGAPTGRKQVPGRAAPAAPASAGQPSPAPAAAPSGNKLERARRLTGGI